MSSLGRRWEYVAGQVEKRMAEHKRKAAMAAPAASKIPRVSPSSPKPAPAAAAAAPLSAKERFFAASPPAQSKLNPSQPPPSPAAAAKMTAKERFLSSSPSTTAAATAASPVNGDRVNKSAAAPIADLGSEEVIDTLPEDAARGNDVGKDAAEVDSSLLSSKDSSLGGSAVDLEVVTGQVIIKSNSPTFIKETVSLIPKSPTRTATSPTQKPSSATSPVRSPPKTLPKPAWFSLPESQPPPTTTRAPPSKSLSSTDTPTSSPSSKSKAASDATTTRDLESLPNSVDDCCEESRLSEEERLANENSAIERILNETNADLAEVVGKRRLQYDFQGKKEQAEERSSRESREFEEDATAMLAKIEGAKAKLDQLDREPDLKLRQDLIGMESKMLEAEVATLISRGDTLVLLTHR